MVSILSKFVIRITTIWIVLSKNNIYYSWDLKCSSIEHFFCFKSRVSIFILIYSKYNSFLVLISNFLAIFIANSKLGLYRYLSIEIIVCLLTPSLLSNFSWVKPFFCLTSFKLFLNSSFTAKHARINRFKNITIAFYQICIAN